jgi:hypothetical protein
MPRLPHASQIIASASARSTRSGGMLLTDAIAVLRLAGYQPARVVGEHLHRPPVAAP